MKYECVTVRPSPIVVGRYNVYLEKGIDPTNRSRCCLEKGLPQIRAFNKARETAALLKLELKVLNFN